jgi:integrase
MPNAEKTAQAAKAMTFEKAAAAFIAAHEAGWRNEKHRAQWNSTLKTYVFPIFGDVTVARVDQAMVMKALDAIWATKPETASRVRGRVEAVLDWASVRGLRTGENPARWRGHLQKALPRRSQVRRVVHQPAMAIDEVPGFMAKLRDREGTAVRALEFTVLCATRTSDTLHAKPVTRDAQTPPPLRSPGFPPPASPTRFASLPISPICVI